jgi:hypothetical protein
VRWVNDHTPDPEPETLVALHLTMMVAWALLLVPTLLWWKDSILWVATMSLYANWVGHFSAMDAAKAAAEAKD